MATYFCNLALGTTGTPGTAASAPWGFIDFMTSCNAITGTVYLKGSGTYDNPSPPATVEFNNANLNLAPWDTTIEAATGVDAPWRMQFFSDIPSGAANLLITAIGTVEGGIIYPNMGGTDTEFYDGLFLNCYFSLMASPIKLYDGVVCRGCSFVSGIGGYILSALTGTVTIYDSVFAGFDGVNSCVAGSFGVSTLAFTRCALWSTPDYGGTIVKTDCQDAWLSPAFPEWDFAKALFDSVTLSVGITTPPQPGTSPYTGYTKGLWRTDRVGIGALDFPAAPTPAVDFTATPVDGKSPLTVNLLSITTGI